ncbi:hypothetical protein D3C80_1845660 [compost metagenome]
MLECGPLKVIRVGQVDLELTRFMHLDGDVAQLDAPILYFQVGGVPSIVNDIDAVESVLPGRAKFSIGDKVLQICAGGNVL